MRFLKAFVDWFKSPADSAIDRAIVNILAVVIFTVIGSLTVLGIISFARWDLAYVTWPVMRWSMLASAAVISVAIAKE